MLTEYKNKMMKAVAIKAISFGIKNYPEYFNERVATVANLAAKNYIDKEMKSMGLIHCALCTKRFSLRKHGEQYFCEKHFKMIKQEA